LDISSLPTIVEWVKKNFSLAVMIAIAGFFLYGAYSFIGGYGTKFGETFAGSYSKFKSSVASYTIIDSMLHDYLTQFNASRIGIARFHNSLHDIGNNSLFFVSFETVIAAPGVSSDIEGIANLPATVYSYILPKLLDDNPVFIHTKDLQQSSLKELFIKRGDKVALFVPIRDLSDKLIGTVVIFWLSENDIPPDLVREQMTKTLQDAARRIGGYFSATNHY
jgi:hypothetical protein